jgi:glycosyltransferase involved in cell wall biosynthesis
MSKPRLIVIGPLPPPIHGVAVSTALVLANKELRQRFEVEHLDTSDHRARENIGRWEIGNVVLGLRNTVQLVRRLRGRRGIVYLPLSQGSAFARDSLFIHVPRLAGWQVAVHLRGSEFQHFYARSSRPLRLWIRVTLRRVASAAVMGASLRGVFSDLVPSDRIAVVPNGTPDPDPDGTPKEPDTVLFLSNLRRRKGVVEAVEAALRVLSERPSARFLFVGSWESPDLEREVCNRAQEAGLAIRFLPPATGEAKRALLLSSSVFLFPPVEPEGHPRVVLEAMAAGVPIVTTDRGAIAETVVDGCAGFVLPDPEPRALAERVLQLLTKDQLRTRMSRAARARYIELYTQEAADRRLAEWLVALAESRSNSERQVAGPGPMPEALEDSARGNA